MNTLKYDDMIKKYYYYKNEIIKNYIQQGIYPDNSLIELTMNRIDLALPLLQSYKISEGSKFDTDKYNETLNQIYTDLTFLYELTYELTVTRFQKLKTFLDTHLTNLQDKADSCYKRALIEKNSTAFGNTIFYQANILPEINNNTCTINFPDAIDLYSKSKIACFLTANNIDPDNIIFILKDLTTNEEHHTTVYNDNQYSFDVPGELFYDTYNIKLADNEITDKRTKILLSESDFSTENKYNAYSGQNKMIVRSIDSNQCVIMDVPIDTSIHIEKHSFIEFYVLNGDTLTFTYNKKPLNANFQADYNTVDLKKQNHIFMECDDDFVFSISLNSGTIYAHNNNSIYNNGDHLIIDNPHQFKDFVIHEYKYAENTTPYNISVIINNIENPQLIIDSVIIKELLPIK